MPLFLDKRVVVPLTLPCLLTLAAFAQDSGTITGKISDTFGYPVSGATIQVKNTATGALYKGTSKATGEYTLGGLPDGAYQLSVRMTNMKPYARQDIAIRSAQPVRVDITLQDDVRLGTLGDSGRFFQRKMLAPPAGLCRIPTCWSTSATRTREIAPT